MPSNKKQIMRMIRFVAELKKNSYPNASSFAKKLRMTDIDENLNISCNTRTIQRDIESLKKDFNAPIVYDHEQCGYYITRKTWEFHCPVFCEGIISSLMIATRLAEDIIPQPIKKEITDASIDLSSTNNSEFLDKCFMESLLIASGTKALVSPDIFKTIFDGWRNQEAIEVEYKKPDESCSIRKFEPHIISFHKGIWYTKGIFIKDNREVVLAIQRIKSCILTKKYFKINRKLLKDVKHNGLFNYKKIKDIIVQCDPSIAFYMYEHQKAKKFKINEQKDGSLIVKLAPAIKYEAIRWILGEGGKVSVIEPEWLRYEVVTLANNIIKSNTKVK